MGIQEAIKTESAKSRRRLSGMWSRAVIAALTLVLLNACVRPTGDFDRAKPSVVHDQWMTTIGEGAARLRGDPVSKFNYTNDEKLLRDRGWTLIRPLWTKDWIGGTKVELARTKILPETDGLVLPDAYYLFLRSDKFRSSDARFDKVASDAKGDADLVMPFCIVALRVKKADDERQKALRRRELATQEEFDGAKARVWENRVLTKWVGQALRFRIIAYKKALASLEIETPSRNRIWKVNTAIRELEGQVRLAESGCDPENRFGSDEPVKKSRIFKGWGNERPPVQK
ncbi:MAG: hypothetical protein ABJJ37_18160 [Roseibium sp.]